MDKIPCVNQIPDPWYVSVGYLSMSLAFSLLMICGVWALYRYMLIQIKDNQ